MNARLWVVSVSLSVLLLSLAVEAQEQPENATNKPPQEVLEKKPGTVEIPARFGKRGRRLSQPQKPGVPQAKPATPLRPLGIGFMVDRNGIIWDRQGKRQVGIWGINGSEIAPIFGGR